MDRDLRRALLEERNEVSHFLRSLLTFDVIHARRTYYDDASASVPVEA